VRSRRVTLRYVDFKANLDDAKLKATKLAERVLFQRARVKHVTVVIRT
jgi:hypothetical protein